MRNLIPPKELSNKINCQGWVEMVFPSSWGSEENESFIASIAEALQVMVRQHFNFGPEDARRGRHMVGMIFWESITNAIIHGNQGKGTIITGIWLGEKGVIFGVKDEGKFFSKKEIKDKIERKEHISSTGDLAQHYGEGLGYIYEGGDILRVETEQNALFVLVSKEKLVSESETE